MSDRRSHWCGARHGVASANPVDEQLTLALLRGGAALAFAAAELPIAGFRARRARGARGPVRLLRRGEALEVFSQPEGSGGR